MKDIEERLHEVLSKNNNADNILKTRNEEMQLRLDNLMTKTDQIDAGTQTNSLGELGAVLMNELVTAEKKIKDSAESGGVDEPSVEGKLLGTWNFSG